MLAASVSSESLGSKTMSGGVSSLSNLDHFVTLSLGLSVHREPTFYMLMRWRIPLNGREGPGANITPLCHRLAVGAWSLALISGFLAKMRFQ